MKIAKSEKHDVLGRFREVLSDPIGLLIERVPDAGVVREGLVTLHNGNRVPISGPGAYYGGYSNILLLNRGVSEPLEEFIFQEVLKRLPDQPIMIELGAYWAHYSMWLKRVRPDARCIMVEPEQENIEAGKANFALNGFDGEFIQQMAEPSGFSVDQYMADQGLGHLDILHVDIQGYEQYLLFFAKQAVSEHKIDYLFIATHGDDHHSIVKETLGDVGYRIEVECDLEDETTSSDGLIFAVRPALPPLMAGVEFMGRDKINGATPEMIVRMLQQALNR
ncbi:MAG: hypothetical protein AAF556_00985 [Pseudomonadota bacterium]